MQTQSNTVDESTCSQNNFFNFKLFVFENNPAGDDKFLMYTMLIEAFNETTKTDKYF